MYLGILCPAIERRNSLKDSDLIGLLSSFACALDADIEHFLQHRAREFEGLSKARTYLVSL